ncbi:MAG: serine hydrolase [Desulfobacterales bacterium]|jgi:beta-lactamase class A
MTTFRCIILIVASAVITHAGMKERPYPLLHDSLDPTLQSALETSLRKEFEPEFLSSIKENRSSIVLVDITNLYRPKVAAINQNVMMYAASLPKIAILLGAFVQIERGQMVLDDQTRATCTRMIRYSSNEDASLILNRVGMENLAEILQSEPFRLYDPEFNGGLWVGRDYSDSPVWKRDPLHQISHGATAMQVARFYYLLFTNRLVSLELTKEMKKILSNPALKHKFIESLEDGPDVKIYRKSGTWKNWHADSGVVVHQNYKYIIVTLSHLPQGGEKLVRLAAVVDDLMKRKHPAS